LSNQKTEIYFTFQNFIFLLLMWLLSALPWLRAAGSKQLKGGRCPVRRSLLASLSCH
jgi:hypothetical protein